MNDSQRLELRNAIFTNEWVGERVTASFLIFPTFEYLASIMEAKAD